MYTTIISAAELAPHLDADDWLIVDCRFDLASPHSGEAAYQIDHVPGAIYAHLDRDLASAITVDSGRHPLPRLADFSAMLGRWGVTSQTQVIAYDADTGAHAARLWWLLRWVGHAAVAVLDGGYQAWRAAGLPVDTRRTQRTPVEFTAHPRRELWLDSDEVAARVGRTDWRLLDARSAERFSGTVEPIDPVAGHVPGARNHPFMTNLGADARFLPVPQLRERFALTQGGVADTNLIAMCGSGVTACHLLLALEIAGKPGAKLYAGSWSEWIRSPSRPIARRAEP